ncbi:winged helix-turn-helix domain-containing protein [Succinatimonas hippei]|uniref:winged helix-turn-helix domain-containing protein n=1 Tax=Succinatimonas hippei TaxID=626938 RepID=UPI003CD0DA32
MIKFRVLEDLVIRATDKVTDKEQELLFLLSKDPGYTMPQLAARLKVSRKTVAERQKRLKEKGMI